MYRRFVRLRRSLVQPWLGLCVRHLTPGQRHQRAQHRRRNDVDDASDEEGVAVVVCVDEDAAEGCRAGPGEGGQVLEGVPLAAAADVMMIMIVMVKSGQLGVMAVGAGGGEGGDRASGHRGASCGGGRGPTSSFKQHPSLVLDTAVRRAYSYYPPFVLGHDIHQDGPLHWVRSVHGSCSNINVAGTTDSFGDCVRRTRGVLVGRIA